MKQNAIGATGFPFGVSGAKFIKIFGSNISTGNTDLYTVPTGRKCLVGNVAVSYQESGGNIVVYMQIKVGGSYYRISANTTVSTGTQSLVGNSACMVLNAGESFAVNTATNNGLNFWMEAVEFDASNTSIVTGRVLALASGDNTIYTVPAGKTAFRASLYQNLNGNNMVVNNSGGSLNYIWYLVPSGGSAGATNKIRPLTAIADKANTPVASTYPSMSAGDFLVVNTSGGGAGQVAWVTMIEI